MIPKVRVNSLLRSKVFVSNYLLGWKSSCSWFLGGAELEKIACSPYGEKSLARSFTFRELAAATRNFKPKNLIGEGGFGRVFKGHLESGQASNSSPPPPLLLEGCFLGSTKKLRFRWRIDRKQAWHIDE